jgi:hypothetical protein
MKDQLFKKMIPEDEAASYIPEDTKKTPSAEDMAAYDIMMAEAEGGKPVAQKTRAQYGQEKREIKKAFAQIKEKLGMAAEEAGKREKETGQGELFKK